jgi:hypothetical protein
LFLSDPAKLVSDASFGNTPLSAIRNCIPFLSPHIPSIRELGESKGRHIAEVLLAHCIVRFRDGRALDELDPSVLKAAATEFGSYPTFRDEEEQNALAAEFDRLVFLRPGVLQQFASEFIEPPLALFEETPTNIQWLNHKPVFQSLRATAPIAWLEKFSLMPFQSMRQLFEMAALHGDRTRLARLIDLRFCEPVVDTGKDSEDENRARARHRFWAMNSFFFGTSCVDAAWNELRQEPGSLLDIQDRVGMFGFDRSQSIPPLSAEAIFRVLDGFVGFWPKVPLPASYGTSSPKGERAYRFLHDLVWRLGSDAPSRKLPVIERLLADNRFEDFKDKLRTLRAEAHRQLALQDYKAPSSADVCGLLDNNEIATVEDLRALMVEELGEIQKWIKGIDTDPLVTFYAGDGHVDENTGRNRVVDRLRGRMTALGLSVVIERHMASGNRCDFTASATVAGASALLVVEVKGQWNPELFTAAAAQLSDRYAIHPDAAGQGIYLVLWFGGHESVAGRGDTGISAPRELKAAILEKMPEEQKALIDVVVLDLSRSPPQPKKRRSESRRTSPNRRRKRAETSSRPKVRL